MPQRPHVATDFTSPEKIRDIVTGMSDRLTVPFAVAAGLSGVVDSTGLVITAGLAEVAAGAIAMSLEGYLAARTDAEHYDSEYAREERETFKVPEVEMEEEASIFRSYGLAESRVTTIAQAIRSDRRR
jgi:VIT1/CCC1 family predicted Fe2+/Mn2+ transporter